MSTENSLKCNCGNIFKEGASDGSKSNSVVRCCVKQKWWSMLQNKCFSDVCFIVGSESEIEEIPAHKNVLSISSTVFETMFSKKWSSDRKEIKVPDIEPSVFSSLLRFIYTDEVQLTADSVMKVLYAAKKYAITTLENQCTDFLTKQLCAENACLLLSQARLFDEAKLVKSCLAVIDENPTDAFKSDNFMNIDLAALRSILERDTLKISEIDLFASVLRWSTAQCEKESLPVTPKNQKSVLKDTLSLIRFPLMTQNEFASSVVPLKLLSNEEVLDVFLHFSGSLEPSSSVTSIPQLSRKRFSNTQFSETRFSKKPRLGEKMQILIKILDRREQKDQQKISDRPKIPFEVAARDTIKSLKEKIHCLEGCHPRRQRFIFPERQTADMENNRTFFYYNVQQGATIFVKFS